jgi:pimeloyl-ACP methyl ester carboxylesterase
MAACHTLLGLSGRRGPTTCQLIAPTSARPEPARYAVVSLSPDVAPTGVQGMTGAERYRVDVPSGVIDDLRARLTRSRLPDEPPRPGWQDGTEQRTLKRLLRRWRHEYDWAAHQDALNELPHLRAMVDGLQLHFVHHHGDAADALPVLLLHGWPSTFLQMNHLAPLLTSGADGEAFDVIVPSLPGFGFSDRPTEAGWNLDRMARAMHELVVGVLGYRRYAVRGSDFGLAIALRLGALYPERVLGIHVGGTHLRVEDPPADLDAEERSFIAATRCWYREEAAYSDVQATKPQTLGVALNDSPAGLLAWIVEKYRTWSVPGALFSVFSEDDLLTIVTIYWATQTITSSARLYREEHLDPTPIDPVRVPLAISQPALEEYRTPERWWRRSQPVARYTELPGASHFPEWEARTRSRATCAPSSTGSRATATCSQRSELACGAQRMLPSGRPRAPAAPANHYPRAYSVTSARASGLLSGSRTQCCDTLAR